MALRYLWRGRARFAFTCRFQLGAVLIDAHHFRHGSLDAIDYSGWRLGRDQHDGETAASKFS
jgi:hypothetical protein